MRKRGVRLTDIQGTDSKSREYILESLIKRNEFLTKSDISELDFYRPLFVECMVFIVSLLVIPLLVSEQAPCDVMISRLLIFL